MNTQQNYLVVPLQIDCCHLNTGKTVMNSLADFSKQPWSDGARDYNADYPYIGETVLAEAFQNDTLYLEPGVHLFWQIPRAFRTANLFQSEASGNDQKFPCVPNRWLINKLDANGKPISQWIVESDFLSDTPDAGENKNPINIAIPIDAKRQPYKYMGRQLSLDTWKQTPPPDSGHYWNHYFNQGLTALGYGESSFSTFYPNCRSVFACWDPGINTEDQTYEVVGWYEETDQDIFNSSQSLAEQKDQLERLNWSVDGESLQDKVEGTLLYGRVTVSQNQSITQPEIKNIAVGYTGAEAVSAYLALELAKELEKVKENKERDNTLKENIEETLEAIMFGSKIKNGSIDSLPNFYEARHQKGFNGEEGGLIWTLRKTGKSEDQDDEPILLPENVAEKLNDLNLAQQACDEAAQKMELLNFQLYSDWCKYIQACYPPLGEGYDFPDMDDIKVFIEYELTHTISNLKQQLDECKKDVSQKLSELQEVLPSAWEINKISAPRYYTPKDPVVLFAGDDNDFSYLNQTGLPELDTVISHFAPSEFKSDPEVTKESAANVLNIETGIEKFKSSPSVWQPQLFQWLTEYYPVKEGSNLGSDSNTFSRDYITGNFSLKENAFDFGQEPALMEDGFQYSGSTYLSGSVKQGYLKKLRKFIEQQDPELKKGRDFSQKLNKWIKDHPTDNPGTLYFAIKAWLLLDQKFIISQSMGGFHQALLQHRHNIHLPVEDPLGFKQYRTFTENIAAQLSGKHHLMAPMPAEQFLPVRAGGFKLRQLKFTDQFGEETNPFDTVKGSIISNEAIDIDQDTDVKWLPPRLCQPVRLNLRWLSASDSTTEVNSHLNTSPVCGWVVANYLNNSLVYYKSDGTQLGSFDQSGKWYPALGGKNPFTIEEIVPGNPAHINEQLLRVLLYMKEQIGTPDPVEPSKFLEAYLNVLEKAQGNIYPASTALHDATALLMSKPMAIVRAKTGFETKGGIRYDQGWDALTANMKYPYTRTTDGYEKILLPIRLGEQKQLDDGLVGYWINKPDGDFSKNIFCANVEGDNRKGITYDDLLQKSLEEEPSTLTILMDPRTTLHATTGILPVKTIQIPAEHYTAALKKIEVDFLTAPVISSEKDVSISTPLEKNKTWEWINKKDNGTDQTETEKITSFDRNGTFTKQKVKEGWLRLKNKGE